MSRWSGRDDVPRGDDYDRRWRDLAAAGQSVHGEADLVFSFAPRTVLDAGCGTGRVAIELDRRGVTTVGVDLDPGMLDTARAKAPHIEWVEADLADVDLTDDVGRTRTFDVVVTAGNVMIFVEPGSEGAVVDTLARHVRAGGVVIAGFQLRPGQLSLADYDALCAAAGLTLTDRWRTWDREPFGPGGDYAVSVHRADRT